MEVVDTTTETIDPPPVIELSPVAGALFDYGSSDCQTDSDSDTSYCSAIVPSAPAQPTLTPVPRTLNFTRFPPVSLATGPPPRILQRPTPADTTAPAAADPAPPAPSPDPPTSDPASTTPPASVPRPARLTGDKPHSPEPVSAQELQAHQRSTRRIKPQPTKTPRVPMSPEMKTVEAARTAATQNARAAPGMVHPGIGAGQNLQRQLLSMTLGQLNTLLEKAVSNPSCQNGLQTLLQANAVTLQDTPDTDRAYPHVAQLTDRFKTQDSVSFVGMPTFDVRLGRKGQFPQTMKYDCGAPIGLMHHSLYEKCKDSLDGAVWYDILNAPLSGYTGDEITVMGLVADVPVRVRKHTLHFNFVVVGGKVVRDLLLGQADARRYELSMKVFQRAVYSNDGRNKDLSDGTIRFTAQNARGTRVTVRAPFTLTVKRKRLANPAPVVPARRNRGTPPKPVHQE